MTDYDYTLLVHLTKNTMIEVFFQIAQNKFYLVIIVSLRSPWKPEAIDVPSTLRWRLFRFPRYMYNKLMHNTYLYSHVHVDMYNTQFLPTYGTSTLTHSLTCLQWGGSTRTDSGRARGRLSTLGLFTNCCGVLPSCSVTVGGASPSLEDDGRRGSVK